MGEVYTVFMRRNIPIVTIPDRSIHDTPSALGQNILFPLDGFQPHVLLSFLLPELAELVDPPYPSFSISAVSIPAATMRSGNTTAKYRRKACSI